MRWRREYRRIAGVRQCREQGGEHQHYKSAAGHKGPGGPTQHPPTSGGGSSPQEDLDPELLAGSGGLVDRLNLSIEPEAPLLRRLQVVVDHHAHPHLELVPPQQGSGARSHVYGLHRHHAVLRVTVRGASEVSALYHDCVQT